MEWYCAYTDLLHTYDENEYGNEFISGDGFHVTYVRDKIVGFDTAHHYNESMSLAEKFKDVLSQAIEYINHYQEKGEEWNVNMC